MANCNGGPQIGFFAGRSNDSQPAPDKLVPLPSDSVTDILARVADAGFAPVELVWMLISHTVAAQDKVDDVSPLLSTWRPHSACFASCERRGGTGGINDLVPALTCLTERSPSPARPSTPPRATSTPSSSSSRCSTAPSPPAAPSTTVRCSRPCPASSVSSPTSSSAGELFSVYSVPRQGTEKGMRMLTSPSRDSRTSCEWQKMIGT